MSYPPLPSNGETNWGTKFTTWADALEGRKVEGQGMSLRYDNSVGRRVFLDHSLGPTMLWGDTGWRDISEHLVNGWTGTVAIRRHDSTVECSFHNVRSDEATSGVVVAFPSGFRSSGLPGSVIARPILTDATVPPNFYRGLLSGSLQIYGWESSTVTLYSTIMFTTLNAWPASLPGTPA